MAAYENFPLTRVIDASDFCVLLRSRKSFLGKSLRHKAAQRVILRGVTDLSTWFESVPPMQNHTIEGDVIRAG